MYMDAILVISIIHTNKLVVFPYAMILLTLLYNLTPYPDLTIPYYYTHNYIYITAHSNKIHFRYNPWAQIMAKN